MDTIHFEAGFEPARTISLYELAFEQYLVKNPPNDRADRDNIITAFEILLELFPNIDTAKFTADHLLLFRNNIARRISKKTGKVFSVGYCNKLMGFVRAVFYWGMQPNTRALFETDIIPPLVSETLGFALSKVPLLKAGDGRDDKKRNAVPIEAIEAVLRYLPPIMADLMWVQYLTGMRPGEVCKMHVGDIKRTKAEFAEVSYLYDGETWLYVLPGHKTEKRIGGRAIPLGAEEQDILSKYMSPDPAMPIFRNKRGKAISGPLYSRTVAEVIEDHGLTKFVPYQIRHTNLTRTSKAYGRDTARAVAGHTTETMTARYDHSDLEKAFEVTKERNLAYMARKAMGSDLPPLAEGPTLRLFSGE